jgi:hypothetical protein
MNAASNRTRGGNGGRRVTFKARLERKHERLPMYVVVPHAEACVLALPGTAVVEGTVDAHAIGRRTIKRWDRSERSAWFVEFTAPFVREAGLAVGDTLEVSLWIADSALPPELAQRLAVSPELLAAWGALSDYARRAAAEHIHAAKSPATRMRRSIAVVDQLAAVRDAPVRRRPRG